MKKSTLLMGAGVAALCAYAYFVEFKGGEEKKKKEEQEERLVKTEKDSVTRFEIANQGKNIKIEKVDAQWKMIEPVQDSADKAQVEQYLMSLTFEKSRDVVAEGESLDLKTFGLDQPMGSLAVFTAADKKDVFEIGSVKAYDGSTYLKLNGQNKIFLGASSWDGHIGKAANDFRDKSVLRTDPLPLYDDFFLSFKKGGKVHQVQLKRTDGIWKPVGSQDAFPIDVALVNSYLDSVKGLRAADFVSSDAKSLGAATQMLKNPDLTLRLKEGDKSKIEILISSVNKDTPPRAYLSSTKIPQPVLVDATAIDGLKKDLSHFFDKKVPFEFDAQQAKRLTLEIGKEVHEVEKKDGKWHLVNTTQKDKEFQADKVDGLIDRISRVEANEILQTVPKGKEPFKPVGVARVFNEKGDSVINLKWAEKVDKKIRVLSSKSERLVSVSDSSWDSIPFNQILTSKAAPPPAATGSPAAESKQ